MHQLLWDNTILIILALKSFSKIQSGSEVRVVNNNNRKYIYIYKQ